MSNFVAKPAVREQVPILIGLVGPSSSGKTFSALRLAMGIQAVSGGSIFGIDTEARRMLHYADKFKFQHVEFKEPFGSLRYLEALQYCVGEGAGVIIVDSMSHEHESVGGMIDFQEKELERLCKGDDGKREKMKMLAWSKPKAHRRTLINGILRLNCNFIFCFRAKHISKPVKKNGKTEVVDQGFVPIAGEDFVYEQTACCFLPPKSGGVPNWNPENPGEQMMAKLPEQFRGILDTGNPLDEDTGRRLAEWAKGGAPVDPLPAGREAASRGEAALKTWWESLNNVQRAALKKVLKDELKPLAQQVDQGIKLPDGTPPDATPEEIAGVPNE